MEDKTFTATGMDTVPIPNTTGLGNTVVAVEVGVEAGMEMEVEVPVDYEPSTLPQQPSQSAQPHPRVFPEPDKHCCVQVHWASGRGSTPCPRPVLWHISRLGYFCHAHFECTIAALNIEPDRIERLSDDERLFDVRCLPGARSRQRKQKA